MSEHLNFLFCLGFGLTPILCLTILFLHLQLFCCVVSESNHCKGTSHLNNDIDTSREEKGKNSKEKEENKEEPIESQTLEKSIEVTEARKLWVEVLSGKRNLGNGTTIEFVTPKIVNGEIEIERDEFDIENEVKFWDSTLIMYVLGGDLSMNIVKQFMMKM